MIFKIFGGAGFIGNHLVKKLLSEGHKVTVFDTKKPRIVGANVYRPDGGEASWYNPVNFIGGDITDFQSVYYIIDRGDIVVNLAAVSQFDDCERDSSRAVKINVTGAVNVAHACILNNAAQYIFTSTGAVYSPFCTSPITEDKMIAPVSFYGLSKKIAEEALLYFSGKLPLTILRFPHVYGPGKTWGANSIISTILSGGRPVIYGDGENKGDFTYVDDVVSAIKLVATKQETGVFNVGSGTSRSVNDFVKLAKMFLDAVSIQPLFLPARKFDNKDFQHDITLIQKLGYKPTYDLECGLQKTVLEWQQWL